jgi:hypothetical protein
MESRGRDPRDFQEVPTLFTPSRFRRLALGAVLAMAGPALAQTRAAAPAAGAGGVKWSVPKAWADQPGSSTMRVATYRVPAAKGAEAGEVAVFFFGPGQGGTVDANVERWSKQFEGTPAAERSAKRVNGLAVSLVRLAGTYLAPGGPAMQSQGKKPDYRLLGAIVEAPEGLVFLKLTGPAATVAAAQADFDALVASLTKG